MSFRETSETLAKRTSLLSVRLRSDDCQTPRLGAVLVLTDGWPAYKEAFLRAFRSPVSTGKRGQPPQVAWPDFVLAQTVKWQEAGRVIGIRVCHLFGNVKQIARLLPQQQVLNTAYIERLNATFRQRLCALCRRTRCLAVSEENLKRSMYLVGTVYNFCTPHLSLGEIRFGKQRWPHHSGDGGGVDAGYLERGRFALLPSFSCADGSSETPRASACKNRDQENKRRHEQCHRLM